MIRRFLLWAIRFYQRRISPGLPPRCRFIPTCSQYAAPYFSMAWTAYWEQVGIKRHRGGSPGEMRR